MASTSGRNDSENVYDELLGEGATPTKCRDEGAVLSLFIPGTLTIKTYRSEPQR